MALKYSFIIFSCWFTVNCIAQDIEMNIDKSFLIIQSTKNYNRALRKAQQACNELSYTLNLRNLYKDKKVGLASSEICGCGEKHGYIPRGRYDDGQYISIEYSDSFEAFSPGYYIVIVASGKRDELNKLLPVIKQDYSDAYIKNSKTYIGCMH